MKLLFYCTKAKPYLYVNRCVLPTEFDRYILSKEQYYSAFGEPLDKLNGKIVAECDYEVEEIFNVGDEYEGLQLYTETLSIEEVLEKSCLSYKDYLGYISLTENYGYAIHLKNLHIFSVPIELSDYMKGNDECLEPARMFHNGFFNSKSQLAPILLRAPQNMMLVSEDGYDKQVLISIRPEWLVEILKGKKTIEVRKKVLKEMLK